MVQPINEEKRWLRTGDVRRLLGISNQAVTGLGDRGTLPYQVDDAGYRIYDREDVERLIARRAAKTRSDADPAPAAEPDVPVIVGAGE